MLKKFFQEKNLHLFFEMSVILKGIHAVIEVVGGLALFVISQEFIVHTLYSITQEELNEDPRDFIATSLLSSASQFTVGGQHFAAFYLLSHGLLKGFLVANLLREKLWAYPAAIVVFGFFIVYQTYRYSITHSFSLMLLTLLDLIVIALTLHEYRYKKKNQFIGGEKGLMA